MLKLREMLIPRLAYLKPGSARWPEKKYGAVWRETREAYKWAMRDIPFTSQVEQVALLAKQADRINEALETGGHSVEDVQVLTNSLIKTVESLRKLETGGHSVEDVQVLTNSLIKTVESLRMLFRVVGG